MELKKIFIKNSRPSYKEKKMVESITRAIEEKINEDPNILKDFKPATNYNELKSLYEQYCIDDVDFHEIIGGDDTASSVKPNEPKSDNTDTNTNINTGADKFDDEIPDFVDPMNRENPIIRDYVMGGEFKGDKPIEQTEQVINEPNSFSEAFEFPEDFSLNDDQPTQQNNGQQTRQNNSTSKQNQQSSSQQNKTIKPLNPDFDDMSAGKKRRSTKKFAKYIVQAFAMLQAKGFVFMATKNINSVKLTEYALNGDIDLDLEISLNEEQSTTVREFFASQCLAAEELAKIDQEKLDDLAESLAEVMLEKGVAPTPQQELLLIGLSILGEQGIKLAVFSSQNNAILQQLKDIKAQQSPKNANNPPPPKTPPPAPPKEEKQSQPEPKKERTPHYQSVVDNQMSEVDRKIKEEEDSLGKGLNTDKVFADLLDETPIQETE